jgi:hypothetical protein
MVRAIDPIGPYAIAKAMVDQGLQVLPARHADPNKAPTVKWKLYQNDRVTENNIRQWFFGREPKNYWVLCGKLSGVVVLDTDSPEGEAFWRNIPTMREAMDRTARVRTSKGKHYWFKIPEGYTKTVQGWAIHPETHQTDDISFDFRGEGGGVLAPPSVHETGLVYTWEVAFEEAIDAPLELLNGTYRTEAPPTRGKAGGGASATVTTTAGGTVRSLLVGLLSSPPAEGGRNEWMARVAGHYAAQYRKQEDLFWLHCQQANNSMPTPLDEGEYRKTCQSLWDKEQGKPDEELTGLHTYGSDNGWLHGSGRRIFTQTRRQDPETGEAIFEAAEWANFDIKAIGVSVGEDGDEADYWVRVFRDLGGKPDNLDVILPGRVLGDTAKLNVWLAGLRVSVVPPDNLFPRSGGYGVRLQRYLEFQKPAKMRITRVLGWDAKIREGRGGFVTHDGILTGSEKIEFAEAGVRPDPALQNRGVAAHHYGFTGSKKEARRVLREVLTFQDETACSIFGAWWAACLLKPQLQTKSSLFPFMAIEAPSESGKTNGFFDLMVQLNGNTRGETVPTFAALRNMTAAHRNGIVWVDDLDDPRHLMELLRAATGGGTITKSGTNSAGGWAGTSDSVIVSPIVLSGESLGMGTTKALQDRAVAIRVGSPTSRMSLHNPDRPQWDDVLELRRQYPSGLSSVAGWLIQLALQQETKTLDALAATRAVVGKGRNADKNGILLAGAMLLDSLVATGPEKVTEAWAGGGAHYARVLDWVKQQQAGYNDTENALTLEVLPWALKIGGWPNQATFSEYGHHTPAFIEGDENKIGGIVLRFNYGLLADAWSRDKHGRVESRTHSADALTAQGRVVAVPGKNPLVGLHEAPSRKPLRYARINGDLALEILRRSRA